MNRLTTERRVQIVQALVEGNSVRATLELLWTSQSDRHGTANEDIPMNVTLAQAQDAVALAATLVHLAQQGGFKTNAG